MARATTKPKKEISMEEALWKSADKLRGAIEPAEYKHVVLSLFFLKFASDKFVKCREKIIKTHGEKYADMKPFYTQENVFYLPEESRWSYIIENAKQDDIALKIDTALFTIEKNNPALKGALPDNYYSRLHFDTAKLASLLDEINRINTEDEENDIIGRVYEYFLSKFALAEGKGKGEFYTPKCIVNLIAEMLEPYDGILYDPCCGSGGMFVQSIKFVEAHSGNKKNVSIYGQEYTNTTFKLAKMNLAIRGISANLGEMAANTFTNDQHKDLKADYIMANPPFNQKEWRAENELVDDPRWRGYEVPPTSNANYGWILNIVSKLSQNGVAGFLLANGALSDDGTELKIRQQLIENHLVEAIIILPRNLFYTTDISVTLWILNKNKKARVVEQNGQLKRYRNREDEILFMDLRQMGSPYEKKYIELTEEDRAKVTAVYHNWQQEGFEQTYENVPEFCYSASFDEVKEKGFTLVPSRYIEFINRDENIDFDTKMKALQSELKDLLVQEEKSKADLLSVFKELGYCGSPAILRSADGIYRDNNKNTMLYVCKNYPECDAYVRVHTGTTIPVGSLANHELRTLRRTAHQYFDQLYLSGMMSKQDAYQWLADLLSAPLSKAHIGYLGEYYCKVVIEESRKMLQKRGNKKVPKFEVIQGGAAS